MSDLHFKKLTPTNDVKLDAYNDAFNFVFSNDDVRNIAISGIYGSGKSSLFKSYDVQNPDKHFIYISLASFEGASVDKNVFDYDESNNKGNEEGKVKNKFNLIENNNIKNHLNKNVINSLEGEIVNQLINQIPEGKIPFSNIKIKRKHNSCIYLLPTILVTLILILLFYFIKLSAIQEYVVPLDDTFISRVLSFSVSPIAVVHNFVFLCASVFFSVLLLFKEQTYRGLFHRISLKGNEIEFYPKNDSSIFDKYLDEIVYLFANSGVDGIVFEDLDRFNSTYIFERLREINYLSNIRKYEENNESKPIRFFYLLRDDLFNEFKDRTKFFDFIIPVVPYVDGSNSFNVLKEYLEEQGIYDRFSESLLKAISLYVDDPRVLENIFNEYLIYNKEINKIDLICNNLIAFITYKNLFPGDYSDLQCNKGLIYSIISNKDSIRKKIITNVKLDNSLESNDALELVNKVKTANITFLINSRQYFDFEQYCVELYDFDIRIKKVVNSSYFGLLKYLLFRGYINETYRDYISRFYPNSISNSDKLFVRSVKDKTGKPADYKLESPEKVVAELDEYDYLQPESLNYSLIDYLFGNNYKERRHIIDQIKFNKNIEFVRNYFAFGCHAKTFICECLEFWPELFSLILTQDDFPEKNIEEICCYILECIETDLLDKININSCLSDYLSNRFVIISNNRINDNLDKLVYLNVSFRNLEITTNSIALKYIYENNLYDISISNIEIILTAFFEIKDITDIYPKFFSFLYGNSNTQLSLYLLSELSLTMSIYLESFNDSIYDSSETIVKLINNAEINTDEYISRLKSKVFNITEIYDSIKLSVIMDKDIVDYTARNFLEYYKRNGFDDHLVHFINSSDSVFDFEGLEVPEQLLRACISCLEIRNDKYAETIRSLSSKKITLKSNWSISKDKLIILIEEKILAVNEINYNCIRSANPECIIVYILNYISAILDFPKSLLDNNELEQALLCENLSLHNKMLLINKADSPLTIIEKNYCDEVLIYIVENRFSPADVSWLAANYTSFSEAVKNSLFIKMIKYINVIISSDNVMNDELLIRLLSSGSVEFIHKVLLFRKNVEHSNKERLCSLLSAIGANDIVDNIRGGVKRVKNNEFNNQLLPILYESSRILKPSLRKDGKHYKKIVYRPSALF